MGKHFPGEAASFIMIRVWLITGLCAVLASGRVYHYEQSRRLIQPQPEPYAEPHYPHPEPHSEPHYPYPEPHAEPHYPYAEPFAEPEPYQIVYHYPQALPSYYPHSYPEPEPEPEPYQLIQPVLQHMQPVLQQMQPVLKQMQPVHQHMQPVYHQQPAQYHQSAYTSAPVYRQLVKLVSSYTPQRQSYPT